jgi:hypothetical protein
MGCGPSRASSFNNLDDSRHVMQNRDMKLLQKQGQNKETAPPPAFKPRAENTVLKPKASSTDIDTDIDTNPAVVVAAPSSFVLSLI